MKPAGEISNHDGTTPRLTELLRLQLSSRNQALLDAAGAHAGAMSGPLRQRLRAEAHELLAISQVAPHRVHVHGLDLSPDGLRAVLQLGDGPLPTLAPGGTEFDVRQGVTLGLHWPAETLRGRLPGTSFVHLREGASYVWHPTVAYEPPGRPAAICLGASLARGIPARELVVMTWGLLTLQIRPTVDERDPARVINAEACRWYRGWLLRNPDKVPLTHVSLLSPQRVQFASLQEN